MTIYYVNSGATGANNGTTKADAFNALGALAAAFAAATANGDIIAIHKAHVEVNTAAQTWAALANIAIQVIDFADDSPAQMDGNNYYFGGNISYTFAGAYRVMVDGIAIKHTNNTGLAIEVGNSDGSEYTLSNCKLWLAPNSAARLNLGSTGSTRNSCAKLINPDIKFGHASSTIIAYGRADIEGGGVNSSGVVPTALFGLVPIGSMTSSVQITGMDLSYVTSTLLADQTSRAFALNISGSSLGAGVTPLATQTLTNRSSGEVYLYDCAVGDVHYALAHYSPIGSTEVVSTIYANDNPTYDGTNKCSWQITTTANASYWSPYVSPWIDQLPASVGSAVTPSFEVLRDGSATAYNNDEVWAEFAYKGTSGSCRLSFANDRKVPLAAAAAQATSSKGAGDWTGEGGSAWFGTLGLGSAITPQEAGYVRGRVCVGAPSSTLYVDPTIRGI